MRKVLLSELATHVGGRLVSPTGGARFADDIVVTSALPLQDATAGCITLADHPKYLARVNQSPASAVMVSEVLSGCPLPMVVVDNLHAAFQKAILLLRPPQDYQRPEGVHPTAWVAPTASIGSETAIAAGASVGENCVLGQRCVLHAGVHLMDGCILGDDCELFPRVTLYHGTRLGNRVLIHAGAVLGAYGFGYRKQQGRHVRTAQLGWVELGDDVEIGATTSIDRGTYGPTRIGEGTKIDNHVQIGHNCHIGKHNLICAQVGIAGSTSTGDNVVLAGQVGIADHLQLADDVTVGAQSGVIGNLAKGSVVVGSPAASRRQRMLEWALIARLPEMRRELKELQEKMAALTGDIAAASGETTTCRRSA